mmetsp:Transcript_7189/g.20209  ORF Transcript_7189/g.20209 Transcript_7189/m.20209 type:complete len:1055 (+) Transcript_7189:96-3260(+)
MAEVLPGQVAEGQAPPESPRSTVETEKLREGVRRWFTERNGQTLHRALAFIPFVLQQAYFEDRLDEKSIVIHQGSGAVVFTDASGFTAVTEKLAKRSNGAEQLSACLVKYFTPLVDLINAYRGDTIKFSGDALTIYFPATDDVKCAVYNGVVPPHGSYGLPDLGPMATAVLRACACCIEIHRRLNNFVTGIDDVRFCMHIGVGCGEVNILQVGGVVPPETHVPRMEYLISGSPIEQISIAEPLAELGETCVSPQAWELVNQCVIEGRQLEPNREYHILLRMDESKYTFPTIKYATQLYDTREQQGFRLSELNVTRRYIPSAVFKQIECDTLQYVNELRKVSVIFISGSGLDVMSENMPRQAQELMVQVQKACYAHEGTLNKFLIDDKGMIFLLVFGLPPLVHPDDPTRAILCCLELVEVFRRLQLVGKFGVTTGRSYCGTCGSGKRMEYTVLGDSVNLSARLMCAAPALGVLCDEETSRHTTGEIVYKSLPPIRVKGKTNAIPVFKPMPKVATASIGLTLDRKIRFPWYDNPMDGSAVTAKDVVASCKAKVLQLCSVNRWAGILKVQEMLGGGFNRQIHRSDQAIPTGPPKAKAPAGSPFAEGGIVVIEGPTGLGKIELAEHIVTHCATQFQMMPIFGTMGPRPGQTIRMAVELLRSTVAVFRHMGGAHGGATLAADDSQALEQIAPPHLKSTLPVLRDLINSHSQVSEVSTTAKNNEVVETAVKMVIALLVLLKRQTPVLVVLQFEHGSSLFDKTNVADLKIFEKMTADLTQLVQKEKSIAGLVLCREADVRTVAVKHAMESNSFIALKGLNEENILEYMSNYLRIPEQTVPSQLKQFVSQVTMGNPLYIRETLDQLIEDKHLVVKPGTQAIVSSGTLDQVDIASWNHTAMVGGTVCRLESLDPIQSAALKVSTCFENTFSLPDLAASTCSQWGGATHFDLLRLFWATRKLVSMGLIQAVDPPPNSPRGSEPCEKGRLENPFGMTQHFRMQSLLIRTVGAALVLEAKKKSVKRNALIDRVLQSELPERMAELAAKKSAQHIPWYYERALRKML